MDGGFLGFSNFPLPSLAEEPPSTHLSFNGHRGASWMDSALRLA
jgi:hypothetical protein